MDKLLGVIRRFIIVVIYIIALGFFFGTAHSNYDYGRNCVAAWIVEMGKDSTVHPVKTKQWAKTKISVWPCSWSFAESWWAPVNYLPKKIKVWYYSYYYVFTSFTLFMLSGVMAHLVTNFIFTGHFLIKNRRQE